MPLMNITDSQWCRQKIFMGGFIQWRVVSFDFGVRCL